MPDEVTDGDVQPAEEGQGEAAASEGGLYDLASVPDDYRPYVERIAKEIDANVTRKFQEASDYRKQWEPYEELSISDYEPEAIEQLLAFAELANDPDSFKEWWESVGDEYGFTDDLMPGDDDEEDEFEDEDEDNPLEAVEQLLEERLSPLMQAQAQSQEQQRIEEAGKIIDQQLADLHEKHGDFDEDAVLKLALAYDDDDAIASAFADYQGLVSNAERGTLENKANGPSVPEGEGRPNTTKPAPTDFKEASQQALERLQASTGQ